jgi:valyl-tRNA synthetase
MEECNIPKTYQPKEIEDRQYAKWMSKGYFHAEPDPQKKPFTIVIPPPNITGQLHMGHALDNTIQDILIRMKRMQGYNALWQPGTDHASIATEVKIIEKLKEEGTDKQTLGREKFLERAWQWKEEYGGRIISQLKKMGSSCDWERERFTMDEGCNDAVTEVFVKMHQKGYIYKGARIINWCPVCSTSISDAEVEYTEQEGHFWHIKYPLLEEDGTPSKTEFLTFATTRPETMLGDTAVAVHPEDERYKHLIGRSVLLPFVDRMIPIIGDTYVDRTFGTGVVKITPAHDPNDFEVGKRHDLPVINILEDNATINKNGGKFQGMDRYAARKAIVKELDEMGLLVKIEPHAHNVGTHDRCKTTIEPMVKEQWFVKMDELIKPAVKAVKEGEIRLIPKRMEKLYFNWTDNIRDWCISRQLWWGHRIPAYTCDQCGNVMVEKIRPQSCPKCGCTHFTQDPDTLDTWFSSALWSFETLGWPKDTPDLKYFYPTDVLVTAYDIIFFWVIRMIFSGYEHMGEKPFKTVFFHGLIRDEQGRKMSKSLGNGIDPLEVIDKYGADALRLTLVTGNAPGNDMRFSYEKVESSRNFANKIWNASRFILMNLQNTSTDAAESNTAEGNTAASNIAASSTAESNTAEGNTAASNIAESNTAENSTAASNTLGETHVCLQTEPSALEPADKWILSRLNTLIQDVTDNMENFELGIAVQKIYDFVWDEFCDWYIEMVKPRLYAKEGTKEEEDSKQAALWTLCTVLRDALKLLHPYMPFITEEIFCTLAANIQMEEAPSIMISSWPKFQASRQYEEEENAIQMIKEAVRGIRNLRSQMNVPPSRKCSIFLVTSQSEVKKIFSEGVLFFNSLARAVKTTIQEDKEGIGQDALTVQIPGATLYVPFAELVDMKQEILRLQKEEQHYLAELKRSDALLKNEKFVAKAPADKLAAEQEKAVKYQSMLEQVQQRLHQCMESEA